MTILIIEDEEPTARKLQRLLTDVAPASQVVGMTRSVDESVSWLQNHQRPDLIFMDIELADGQSFDIFNQVNVVSPVVFTTAYDEYAIQAFKVNSIDYLLKPIKETDLRRTLDKLQQMKLALENIPSKDNPDAVEQSLANLLRYLQVSLPMESVSVDSQGITSYRDRFLIKQGQRLFSVHIDDVAYFFSRNKMSFLKATDNQDWMIDYTLDELSQMLDPKQFFRLNRQVIAKLWSIDKVHLYFNGKLKISLRPAFEDEVVVSREKAGELKIWLGE